MTTTAATPTSSARRPHGSLIVLVGLVMMWALWAAVYLLSPDHNADGRCEGLGWGCTLTPRQFVGFAGLILLAPVTLLAVGVTSIVRFVRIKRGSPRTPWDIVVWVIFAAMTAYWLFATVTGAI